MITLYALAAAVGVGVLWLGTNIKVVKQFERGVGFRFGRVQSGVRGPGLTMLVPVADRLQKVNMQIITLPVPAQDGITRDNVTVRVDAVIYFNVVDPVRAVVDVQDYMSAIGQVAQTSLRSVIGKSNLDDLLSNRERLNQGLELLVDSPAGRCGARATSESHYRRRRVAGVGEVGNGGGGDGRAAGGAPAAAAGDGRRGCGGEELHSRAALPRRTAPVPRTVHPTVVRARRARRARRDVAVSRGIGPAATDCTGGSRRPSPTELAGSEVRPSQGRVGGRSSTRNRALRGSEQPPPRTPSL